MKPIPISLSLFAGGFCAFFATAYIGWSLAGDSSAPPANSAQTPAAVKKNDRHGRPSRLSAAAILAEKRLASVNSAANPEARMRATIDLANSLPVSEFAAWMDGGYFNLRGGAELTLFSKILMERWMKEDPEGLVEWSMKSNTYQSQTILAKWADQEPQRAIDFFKNHPDDVLEMNVLQTLATNHPELALRRLQELVAAGISSKASNHTNDLMHTLAEKSPAALEAMLASLPAVLQSGAETALSGQRLKTSFTTELRALWEQPNGWKIFEANAQRDRKMSAGLFAELENLPPAWKSSLVSNAYYFMDSKTAPQWLDADLTSYGFTEAQTKSMQIYALHSMNSRDPEAVIKRMEAMNLEESTRQNMIRNALSNARENPEKTDALVALLSSDADKTYARSVLKGQGDDNGDPLTLPKSPDEWLEKISGLDVKNNNAYSLISSIDDWDSGKMSQLKSQFNQMPHDKKQVVAQIIANNSDSDNSSSDLRGDAIRYLAGRPEVLSQNEPGDASESISAMTSSYVVHLAKNDADAASEWVRALPAGDAKSWAEKNLASNWVQYDPKAVEQWLKTLPASSRDEVKKFMTQKK